MPDSQLSPETIRLAMQFMQGDESVRDALMVALPPGTDLSQGLEVATDAYLNRTRALLMEGLADQPDMTLSTTSTRGRSLADQQAREWNERMPDPYKAPVPPSSAPSASISKEGGPTREEVYRSPSNYPMNQMETVPLRIEQGTEDAAARSLQQYKPMSPEDRAAIMDGLRDEVAPTSTKPAPPAKPTPAQIKAMKKHQAGMMPLSPNVKMSK